MRSNIRGSFDISLITRVQVPAVANLHDVQHDPIHSNNDRVQSERRVVVLVLVPDSVAVMFALSGTVERVVDAGDDKQKP